MSNPEPKVTLVTWTQLPLETVYVVWQASKEELPLMSIQQAKEEISSEAIESLFEAVIAQRIPIGEHVDFVFMLENVSISWREQAVRHRIGTKPSPERLGVDIGVESIPNLSESSWWSQSMRIMDMSKFAEKSAYRLPKTVANHPDSYIKHAFQQTMEDIAETYKYMVDNGIPMEDAREVMPLGAHHRISWKLNISALQHIIGERGCWILQLGLWGPIIMGMVEELVNKVHPVFSKLVTPPCIGKEGFKECIYQEECRRRLDGQDELPPCPLHLSYHHLKHTPDANPERLASLVVQTDIPMKDEMIERAEEYKDFWGRNPYTGERL